MMRHALIAAAAATSLAGATPALAQELSSSQIERGRYLAIASNCVSCHTDIDNDGIPWAGGREMDTPFGVIITPNITFDNDTGIGRYTRDDFWRAMHEGVRRDGEQLYPAFPYPYFTRMPREDVDAIYDYLQTIEPVRSDVVPEAELAAPFRVREAVRGWKLLHFDQGVFEPDPQKSDEWNRGAYLVRGPGHCAACHTEKTLTGGDAASEDLRGGVLENWHAPNIRGGENGGIAHWSEDDIVEYLGTGRASHTMAMQRMGEVVGYSTQHLREDDLRAIAVYLKDLDDEPRDTFDPPTETAMQTGEAIYFDNCAACHRSDGAGVDHIFARLDGSNKINSDDATTIIRVVLEGARAEPTERWPHGLAMPAFSWKLTDEQIADVLNYTRHAWGNNARLIDASEVADLREYLEE
ncbi:MAG: c-type cytochrome [Rhizobiaceae bacterium]